MAKCIASWKTLAIILFYVEPNANNFHLSMALSDIVPQICWRNAACNLAMSGGCDINVSIKFCFVYHDHDFINKKKPMAKTLQRVTKSQVKNQHTISAKRNAHWNWMGQGVAELGY